MKKIYLPLAALLSLSLIGCSATSSTSTKSNPVNTQNSEISQKPEQSNLFDLKVSKVGDMVAGMKIKSLDTNMGVNFEGETEITGDYKYYPADFKENPSLKNMVCMSNLAPQSEASLPTMSLLDGTWFCFSNTKFAKAQLSNSQGTATVRIKNYKISGKQGTPITAELVSVVIK